MRTDRQRRTDRHDQPYMRLFHAHRAKNALNPRRRSSSSPPWKPQISQRPLMLTKLEENRFAVSRIQLLKTSVLSAGKRVCASVIPPKITLGSSKRGLTKHIS
jgi:hypothetical protein